jgi:ech hydrogenase subunit D
MSDPQTYYNIELNELLGKVQGYADQNARLIQICCARLKDSQEINYSFDLRGSLENLKIKLPLENPPGIPSVSKIYFCGMLYENEMQDLFGLKFKDLVLDYAGTFYRTSTKHPFINQNKIVAGEKNE